MNLELISEAELQKLFQKSKEFPRRRAIKKFSNDEYTGPHVCLNIIQPDSYIQPHLRFVDESLLWYCGKLISLQLHEDGGLKKAHILSAHMPYVFLPKYTYHTVISLEEDSALWMVVQGPHKQPFSEFLSGTPSEKEEHQSYFSSLKNIGLAFI